MFNQTDEFLNIFEFRERTKGFRLTDINVLYYIELPKVNGRHQPVETLNQLETYLEYMRLAEEAQDAYLKSLIAHGGEELKMVQHIMEKVTQEDILREKALAREKWEHDMAQMESSRKNSFKWGKEAGMKQGRQEGIEQGIEQGIHILIEDNLEDGKTKEQIVDKLKKRYDLTENDALRYFTEFKIEKNKRDSK